MVEREDRRRAAGAVMSCPTTSRIDLSQNAGCDKVARSDVPPEPEGGEETIPPAPAGSAFEDIDARAERGAMTDVGRREGSFGD